MSANLNATTTRPKRILMIAANPTVSTNTGWPVGFWASELTHPHYEFTEAGYEAVIASPQGGRIEPDGWSDPRDSSGYSAHDLISMGFLHTPKLAALLENTKSLAQVNPANYDAVLVCGGQAPMFTFRENAALQTTLAAFYEAEKPTAALCHGVAALIDVKVSDGSYLIAGKTMTGFSNIEEAAADQAAGTKVMPWHIETAARERGANYIQGGLWKPFAVRDGRLITGQQLGRAQDLRACYEAGPTGYVLYWQLTQLGVACEVIAPTLVPTKAGDRVKTDRRDAMKLARCHRAGELTAVWVPDADHEALRDLVRAREAAKKDQLKARHRLGKFLLRHGRRPPEGTKAWTQKHREWIKSQVRFEQAALEATLADYLEEVDHVAARS